VLKDKVQTAENAHQKMGVEWLGRSLVGRQWRSARQEKGLFSESRELPRNTPFYLISSEQVILRLKFHLQKGIESEFGNVRPPFERVKVVIKTSTLAKGSEGLFCSGKRIEKEKLNGVYDGAELALEPLYQPSSPESQRYFETKQRVIDALGVDEFNERLPYLLHSECEDATAPAGWYKHYFFWGDPHYGNALGKINNCRRKSCRCNVEAKKWACQRCARRQNVWWDYVEDVGKVLVVSKRAIQPNEMFLADHTYPNTW
jgi:hypothetical protein